jgi:transcriptional regulator with XRE-family HTH domain
MCWQDELNMKYKTVSFSLRDLRVAKGLTQKQVADVCEISKALYYAIEVGRRRPSIDVLFVLASLYKTSMNFIYHAYYRQYFIFNFPDHELQYAKERDKRLDIQYLTERFEPLKPPELPHTVIFEKENIAIL